MKKMYLAYKQHTSVQISGTLIIFKLRLARQKLLWFGYLLPILTLVSNYSIWTSTT